MTDETVMTIYAAGVCITFGAIISKMGFAAILLCGIWPAYWLAAFGYWLAN